jgi:hypothetical protein
MPEIDESRRKLLLGAGGATAAIIAGAAIRNADDGITFESVYSTNRFDAVVEDGPTADSGPAYYADVITSEVASSRVFWERFPESAIIDYRDIDFREKFISLFVSRYWICEPGHLCAASPKSDFRDDRLVYELDTSEVDVLQSEDPEYSDSLYVEVHRWRYEGVRPPREAVIELQ